MIFDKIYYLLLVIIPHARFYSEKLLSVQAKAFVTNTM